MTRIAIAFAVALIVSLLASPFAIKLAHKIGAIDVPRDTRRVHKKPVPRLGGVAIVIGFMVSFIIFTDIAIIKKLGIIVGSLVIVACGIYDDTKGVTPKQKLLAQFIAALVLYFSGIGIKYVTNPFAGELIRFDHGIMSIIGLIISIVWIIGITNTINLIDGLDGLAGGVAAIASMTLGYIAFLNGRMEVAVVTFVLAGACIGFLPFNFNPAKTFMGDTGALFIGFILAAISVDGSLKSAAAITTLIPIIALGLPIFDTTFAILRRYFNGKPIMQADSGHFHHRLLSLGLHQREAVMMMYLITAMLGGSSILFAHEIYNYGIALLSLTAVVVVVPVNLAIKRYKEEDLLIENQILEMESQNLEMSEEEMQEIEALVSEYSSFDDIMGKEATGDVKKD